VGMMFNADEELFVTDQEGATWLPNGNPLDELLHIQPGRHYGFPPRHPRHLPNVFDEPSLFDYGPQHQSTCGLAFNLPLQEDGPIFGPTSWHGDALVCGEARGKLYRTQLVRGGDGRYVARNHLIGSLGMLAVDCCLTPAGDLLVACHSGGPDWGTGPNGIGKLFRIRYEELELPQPAAVWAASPQEVRVAFDKPLDPQMLKDLAAQSKITYGEYVAAGDPFETLRPGYAVVQMQLAAPRVNLPIYSASVTPDRRTLILATAPHPAAVRYSLTLPGLSHTRKPVREGHIAQHPQMDLAYSLDGVQAEWQPHETSQAGWSGWLPHPDLHVARAFSPPNAEIQKFWELIEQPGTLTLTTQFDPRGLFAPAVQPLASLDYEPSDDLWITQRAVRFQSDTPFAVASAELTAEISSTETDGIHQATVVVSPEQTSPMEITLRLETGQGRPSLGAS